MGDLLFLIYMNDISGVVNNKLPLYASDSAVLVDIVLQQRSPKVTCTHTGRVTSSIIHHFKAQSVLSSEMHDANFRILCEKNYGPLNMGTVIIAQKGMTISF